MYLNIFWSYPFRKIVARQGVLVLFVLLIQTAFGQSFKAISSAKEVPQNLTFEISYTIENAEIKSFSPPPFNDFDAYGPSQSSNVTIVNGKMSQSKSFTYTLKPKQQGEFSIEPATAVVDGKTIKSNPVYVKVIAPVKNPPQQRQQAWPFGGGRQQRQAEPEMSEEEIRKQLGKEIFVAVIPSKTTVYSGEQLTLTYKLYYRTEFRDLQISKMPNYFGFLMEEFEIDKQQQQKPTIEEYGGRKYYTQEFRRIAIFPNKPGSYNLEPMEFTGVVFVRVEDPFFGPFFSNVEPFDYTFKSNAITVNVKPLPTSKKPTDFSGAVGNYSVQAKYDKTKAKAGEPIKLRLSVSGKGNIKLIQAPVLEFPEAFEAYEPAIEEQTAKEANVLTGTKTFEYILVPLEEGSFVLPTLNFTHFNPDKSKYEVFTLPETTVEIKGGHPKRKFIDARIFKKRKQKKVKEIYGIYSHLEKRTPSQSVVEKPWWMIAISFPWLVFLLVWLYDKLTQRDPAAMKRRKALRAAMKRMRKAEQYWKQKKKTAFYNEVIRAFWEYLSERLHLPQSVLSKENITQKLLDKQATLTSTEQLQVILNTCEEALFSPNISNEDMEQVYHNAIEWIAEAEDFLKK